MAHPQLEEGPDESQSLSIGFSVQHCAHEHHSHAPISSNTPLHCPLTMGAPVSIAAGTTAGWLPFCSLAILCQALSCTIIRAPPVPRSFVQLGQHSVRRSLTVAKSPISPAVTAAIKIGPCGFAEVRRARPPQIIAAHPANYFVVHRSRAGTGCQCTVSQGSASGTCRLRTRAGRTTRRATWTETIMQSLWTLRTCCAVLTLVYIRSPHAEAATTASVAPAAGTSVVLGKYGKVVCENGR